MYSNIATVRNLDTGGNQVRKIDLANDKLEKIRELHESGYSWLKIQEMAGVERRLAKRAYYDWLQGRTLDEIRQARVDVASQALSNHIDSLVKVAQQLVSHLDLPGNSRERKPAEEILRSLWETNILGEFYEISSSDAERKHRYNLRQNKRLFESLQTHTQGRVRWQALAEWQKARDNCRGLTDKLKVAEQRIISEVCSEESGIQEELKELSQGQDASKWLAHVALGPIWQDIRSGQFDPEHPEVSIAYGEVAKRVHPPAEIESIKKIVAACQRVAVILLQEPTVLSLHTEAQTMRRAIEELEDTLDPLVLRPVILLSPKCKLCPA